jgi:hypothetical protein
MNRSAHLAEETIRALYLEAATAHGHERNGHARKDALHQTDRGSTVESRWGFDRTRTSSHGEVPLGSRDSPPLPPVLRPHPPAVPPEKRVGLERGKSCDG